MTNNFRVDVMPRVHKSSTSGPVILLKAEQLAALPVIVTGIGQYRTRNGMRATIERMPDRRDSVYAQAFGSLWNPRSDFAVRGFHMWMLSGRRTMQAKPHPHDIVGPWKQPSKSQP